MFFPRYGPPVCLKINFVRSLCCILLTSFNGGWCFSEKHNPAAPAFFSQSA